MVSSFHLNGAIVGLRVSHCKGKPFQGDSMEWCVNDVTSRKKCLHKLYEHTLHRLCTAYELCVHDKSSMTVPILRLKFKVCFAHTLWIPFSLVPTGFVK